jgi:hypothetical protein
MLDILKIFLGADERGYDTEELRDMRMVALAQGFVTVRNHIISKEMILDQKPKHVFIRGGYTDVCVAKTAQIALDNGAKNVRVDLRNCRTSALDTGQSPNAIFNRSRELYVNLRFESRRDNRLTVLPGGRSLREYFDKNGNPM